MMRYLCQVPSDLNFLHSRDDCFAAQIVYAADPSSVAPQGEGGCPPMYRLVTYCRSFHFSVSRFKSHDVTSYGEDG